MEALIQELPKFRLKAVPTDCSECPICLEEFHIGNEVSIFWFNKGNKYVIANFILPEHKEQVMVNYVQLNCDFGNICEILQ